MPFNSVAFIPLLYSLERVYPLTLGSNIGTTTTSILASMAAGGEHVGQVRDAILFILFTRARIFKRLWSPGINSKE
jgi:hypothetical protein